MRTRFALLAAAFGAVAVLLLPSSATAGVILEEMPAPGARLDRTVNLDRDAVGADGKGLPKGTYDLKIESLGNGNVKAIILQGGARKGEAKGIWVQGGARKGEPNGIIVQGGAPHAPRTFADLGLNPTSPYTLTPEGGKLTLRIGAPGANQIFIWFAPPPAAKQ